MRRIRSTDTKPELVVRRLLYSMGYRYHLHARELPGRPDIVFRHRRAAIFIHGCFWHLHRACRDGTFPKTRMNYWSAKLRSNTMRDRRHLGELRRLGWRVLRVWECDIEKRYITLPARLESFLRDPGSIGKTKRIQSKPKSL